MTRGLGFALLRAPVASETIETERVLRLAADGLLHLPVVPQKVDLFVRVPLARWARSVAAIQEADPFLAHHHTCINVKR